MSQWTHVLGVIRFDSMAKNVHPEPYNKDDIIHIEMDMVHNVFQHLRPEGSEGSLEIKTILTNRGPTVVISGDLRDFGEMDLQDILIWVNQCAKALIKQAQKSRMMIWPRDGFINCDVEYSTEKFIIESDGNRDHTDNNADWFALSTYPEEKGRGEK